MRSWRWYSKVLFALLVAAFAYWVWPTPWQYGQEHEGIRGRSVIYPLRMQRISGRTQLFSRKRGWEDIALYEARVAEARREREAIEAEEQKALDESEANTAREGLGTWVALGARMSNDRKIRERFDQRLKEARQKESDAINP
jgi:hypothetical protein